MGKQEYGRDADMPKSMPAILNGHSSAFGILVRWRGMFCLAKH
jgi:hypothetical protein